MTDFTHIFLADEGQIISIEDAPARITAYTKFYPIHNIDKFSLDRHGKPSYQTGGWSYGHIQGGWICAGAGGLNSMKLSPLAQLDG